MAPSNDFGSDPHPPPPGGPDRRLRGPRQGLVVIGLVVVALIAWLAFGHKKPQTPRDAAVAVSTAKVAVRDVPITLNALGSAQPWQSVLVRAQVSGRLLSVPVREGSEVKAGDLIAQIDPAPYQAQLTQAMGALKRDEAQLGLARLQLTRYRQLASQDSIARQDVDQQAALVQQSEGLVMIDQGAVTTARLNLGYTRITAPVTGRIGLRLVDSGNLIAANDTTGIVTINQLSPIAVVFTVPQGDFQRLSAVSSAFQRPLATLAFSQETGALLGSGELSVADNHVDPSTGTVRMKARFANADRRLWPGQMINVQLTVQILQQATVTPAAAVNTGPSGQFVYVVGADRKVAVRPITVLSSQDDFTVISSGLKAGETVVTDGQVALRPGASVRVRPAKPGA